MARDKLGSTIDCGGAHALSAQQPHVPVFGAAVAMDHVRALRLAQQLHMQVFAAAVDQLHEAGMV